VLLTAKTRSGIAIYTSKHQIDRNVLFEYKSWPGMPIYESSGAKGTKETEEGAYKGSWLYFENGQKTKQGFGSMEYSNNGSVYEGWWLNGKKHGMGRMIY